MKDVSLRFYSISDITQEELNEQFIRLEYKIAGKTIYHTLAYNADKKFYLDKYDLNSPKTEDIPKHPFMHITCDTGIYYKHKENEYKEIMHSIKNISEIHYDEYEPEPNCVPNDIYFSFHTFNDFENFINKYNIQSSNTNFMSFCKKYLSNLDNIILIKFEL